MALPKEVETSIGDRPQIRSLYAKNVVLIEQRGLLFVRTSLVIALFANLLPMIGEGLPYLLLILQSGQPRQSYGPLLKKGAVLVKPLYNDLSSRNLDGKALGCLGDRQ